MSKYLEDTKRNRDVDAKDIIIMKGLLLGKTLRALQEDILAKSHNAVEERVNRLIDNGYIKKHEKYSRLWELTERGREEVRKYIS